MTFFFFCHLRFTWHHPLKTLHPRVQFQHQHALSISAWYNTSWAEPGTRSNGSCQGRSGSAQLVQHYVRTCAISDCKRGVKKNRPQKMATSVFGPVKQSNDEFSQRASEADEAGEKFSQLFFETMDKRRQVSRSISSHKSEHLDCICICAASLF